MRESAVAVESYYPLARKRQLCLGGIAEAHIESEDSFIRVTFKKMKLLCSGNTRVTRYVNARERNFYKQGAANLTRL